MPGIAGIISNREEKNLFQTFLNKLNHFDYKIESYYKNGIHLGRVHLDYVNRNPQPVLSGDNRYAMVMVGEVFNYQNLEPNGNDADAQFLLDLIIEKGLKCLSEINGQFIAALYDFNEKKTILLSDRYGTRPLYYTIHNNRLLFASEVKSLLAANLQPTFNMDAISDLFHLRHLFGFKTMFQEIMQLPNASILTFKDGKISIEEYYEAPLDIDICKTRNFSKREVDKKSEEFGAVIDTAMKRVFTNNKDDILFSLSGGLDSRFVIASAKKNKVYPIEAFTIGPPDCGDQIYAKQVAEKLGAKHKQFPVNPEDFWENARKYSYYSDGMSQIYGPVAVMPPLEEYFTRKKITVSSQIIDTIVGGTLYRNRVQDIVRAGSFHNDITSQFVDLFAHFNNNMLGSIFNKEVYSKIKDGYKKMPEEYTKRYPVPAHCYFMFFLNEYGRRGTLGGNVLTNLFYDTRMPSYDKEFMEYALNIPIELRNNQYLYRKVFTTLYPDLAKIKREGNELPISASNLRLNLRMMEKMVFDYSEQVPILNSLTRMAGYKKQITYLKLGDWFRYDYRDKMIDLVLGKQVLSRGLYNPQGLKNLLDVHIKGKADYSGLLWQIINLEYFFRNFVD